MAEFKVLRRHDGDKEYHAGDTRTADAGTVAHLVKLGVLEPLPAAKVSRAAANKAAAPVKNKAAGK